MTPVGNSMVEGTWKEPMSQSSHFEAFCSTPFPLMDSKLGFKTCLLWGGSWRGREKMLHNFFLFTPIRGQPIKGVPFPWWDVATLWLGMAYRLFGADIRYRIFLLQPRSDIYKIADIQYISYWCRAPAAAWACLPPPQFCWSCDTFEFHT